MYDDELLMMHAVGATMAVTVAGAVVASKGIDNMVRGGVEWHPATGCNFK